MIRLYRDKSKFNKYNIIVDNDSFFNNNVAPKHLTDISLKVMKDIDEAELIDKELGTIKTPYGITSIDNLSTGCKTILNYIYLSNTEDYKQVKAIDITECGWNAIELMFTTIETIEFDIALVLEHTNDIYKCKERQYLVDDTEYIDSLFEF